MKTSNSVPCDEEHNSDFQEIRLHAGTEVLTKTTIF